MELPLIGSPPPEIFHLDLPIGRPAASSLLYSLCVHAALVTALFTVSLPQTGHDEKPAAPLAPTELRLDGHLYYVSEIPASSGENHKQESTAPAIAKRTLPRAAESGKMPAPVPAVELPKPPQIAMPSQLPALPSANAEIAATRQQVRRMLARTFVPPEVKRNPAATQTLIQPLSPPDLVPRPTPLPSFRVSSPQFPKIPKPLLIPGRKNPAPPAQVPEVIAPDILLRADSDRVVDRPKLALPPAPPPPEPAPATVPGPPPAPVGDGVSILSLSDRPVPMNQRVVVPAGNIAQESGEAAAAQPGAPAGASSTGTNAGSKSSATGANASATSSATASASPAPTPSAPRTGTSSGAPVSTASNANSAANPASPAISTTTATTSESGKGRGSVGTGTGAALAGASATGSTSAVAGSTAPVLSNGPGAAPAIDAGKGDAGKSTTAGTGAGAGSGNGRAAPGQVIHQPPGGSYDAVVIQSSPVDQYPETRGLLSGRPIYSVYISAGAGRDWTLYFCLPNTNQSGTNGPVVQIDAPSTPVKAPYAFKLVKPAVTLPAYEKYVLVHGYVTAEGHFQNLHIVRTILPDIDRSILTAMTEWEFRAATKDGVPVQVEFLLSIPAKGL